MLVSWRPAGRINKVTGFGLIRDYKQRNAVTERYERMLALSTVGYWPAPGRDGEAESGAIDGKRNHPTGGSENEDEGDVKGVIAKLAMED